MELALLRLKRELKELAEAHQQVRSFHYGEWLSILKDNSVEYCSVWAVATNSAISDLQVDVTLEIGIFDKLLPNGKNEDQVLSDTLLIANDLYGTIRMSPRWQQWMQIVGPWQCTPHTNDQQDVLAGHRVTLQLKIKAKTGFCDIPIKDYDFGEGAANPAPSVNVRNTTGGLIENVIAGFPAEYTVADSIIQNSDGSVSFPVPATLLTVVPDIDVVNSANEQIAEVPAMATVEVADVPVELPDGSVQTLVYPASGNAVTTNPISGDFSVDNAMVEVGDLVEFTEAITGAPTLLHWDFGDGNDTTGSNPTHSYGATGIYTPTLTAARDGAAKVITKPGLICVSAAQELSLDFNGTSNYLTIPPSPVYDAGNGDFTYTAWVKRDQLGSFQTIYGADNAATMQRQFQFGLWSDDRLFMLTGSTSGGLQALQLTTTTLTDTDWHLLSFKKISNQFVMSIDTVPQPLGSLNGAHGPMADQGAAVYISAKNNGGFTQIFGGQMANLSAFNIGLSTAQEIELYNGGNQMNIMTHSAWLSGNVIGAWNGGTQASFNPPTLTVPDLLGNDATSDNMDLTNLITDTP